MEAVGAAGAIVGLAGSALAGLKSLGEFIAVLQDGKIDLDTMRQRLLEQEFRLSELRTEYDSLPTGFIIPEEKILLDECIKGSHEEVSRYKRLLDKTAKTRAQRKSFQKVETAVRMYLHGEEFKKHRSMLQDRTLRLQEFSERLYRVRTSESFQSIMSSATQHHDEHMAAHTRTADTLRAISENLGVNIQESLNTSLAVDAHVTAVMGNYYQQTQTLIQASHLSTVQELNKSMSENILPIIQSMFDDVQSSDRDFSRRNQRGAWLQHQGHNRLFTHDSSDGRVIIHTEYRTPLGRLHVSYSRKNTATDSFNAGNIGAAYWIKFDPYRIFSKSFVDWKLFLNTGCTGPPTTVWCKVGTLCEDIEVIDALGLIPKYYNCSHEKIAAGGCMRHTGACKFSWRTKLPDSRKLRRLLEERRFSPSDYMRSSYGTIQKILTVFIYSHRFCATPQQQIFSRDVPECRCFGEAHKLIVEDHSDLIEPGMANHIIQKSRVAHEYLTHFYPAYYATLKLLLEVGCEPGDDWDNLMSDIACSTSHIIESHTPYASTDFFKLHSIMELVRLAVKRPFATVWFSPTAFRLVPCKIESDEFIFLWGSMGNLKSHIGNLLPHENFYHELEEVIFDIGGAYALNRGYQYDRWLLVLMSYMQPRLRTLIASDAGNWRKANSWDFSIERVLEEIENAPDYAKGMVAEYVVFYGNLDLLQVMIQKGFDPSALLSPACRKKSPKIMDFVLQSCLKQRRRLPFLDFIHHHYTKRRIIQDPGFRTQLLEFLVSEARQASQQLHNLDKALLSSPSVTSPHGDAFLTSEFTIGQLMLTKPAEVPAYIRAVVDGCISRYNEEHLCFSGGIWIYLLSGLRVQHSYQKHLDRDHTGCEDLGRPESAFHQILRQLLSSSAFGCGLEHVPIDKPYDQEPDIEDYTPLLLALYGGMIPAVKMLVEAGAAIRDCAPCGRSALQFAEYNAHSNHPRVCWTRYIGWSSSRREPHYVSRSADEEMLQILQDAFRSRGEEVFDPCLSKQSFVKSMPCVLLRTFWKLLERIEIFSDWFFGPTAHISMEDVSERLSYVAVVFTITFLSIAQLLRLSIDGNVSEGLFRLLSRPVVMIPITAWIIRSLWRQYFVEPK